MAKKIYSKEVPSDPALMPEVEEFVLTIAKGLNLAPDRYNNLALSVAEAISNSMQHGNSNDITKKVKINISIDDDFLKISFKDEGNGFDPRKIPDPTKPENILKDSGRGIHIMRSFLDDLQFKFHNDGTEIIMIMKLNKE